MGGERHRHGVRAENTVRGNEGIVVQAGQIFGDVHFSDPTPAPRPLGSTLPRAAGPLTGREAELDAVLGAANPVRLLVGMGGCGKSALAIAAADRLRDAHPGGVVFLACHGYAAHGEFGLREAAAELQALLQVPGGPTGGPELVRRRFAEFARAELPLLLVLDDVGPRWDVRELLPTDAVHGVLLTSRDQLDVDAAVVRLAALPAAASVELLRREIVRGDPADPRARRRDELRQVAERCGHLPLALRVVGDVLRGDPRREPRVVAADLDSPHRLSVLERVRSAVALSVAALRRSPERVDQRAAELFDRLGMLPRLTFTADRVAPLLDEPDPRLARLLLDRLGSAHLLEPRTHGGAFHDLTGECAAESFTALPAARRRSLALRFAERCAEIADAAVAPLLPGADASAARIGAALRTLHDEHEALLAGLRAAAGAGSAEPGSPEVGPGPGAAGAGMGAAGSGAAETGTEEVRTARAALRIAAALVARCERTGRAAEAVRVAVPMVRAAQVLGDRDAELRALLVLCEAHLAAGRHAAAARSLREAGKLARALDELPVPFLATFARLAAEAGEHEAAVEQYRWLLDRARRDGDVPGQCAARRGLGRVALLGGDLDEAARRYGSARELAAEHGCAEQVELAANELGAVLARRGDVEGAARQHRAALDSARQHGFPHRAATALHHLADLHAANGDAAAARRDYERCARLYRDAGDHRRAEQLAARLRDGAAERAAAGPGAVPETGSAREPGPVPEPEPDRAPESVPGPELARSSETAPETEPTQERELARERGSAQERGAEDRESARERGAAPDQGSARGRESVRDREAAQEGGAARDRESARDREAAEFPVASAPRPRLRAALKFLPAPALALLVLLVVQPVLARYGHGSAAGWACWSVAVPLLLLNAARGVLRGTAVPLPAWLRWADLLLLAAVLGYVAAVLREFTAHPALVIPAVLAPPLLVAFRKLRRR